MTRTVTLSKPLTTHKGEVTSLEVREVTAADMVEARSDPFETTYVATGMGENMRTETKISNRYDVLMTLAAKLTGVDALLLSALSAKDFRALTDAVGKEWNGAKGE